MTAGNRRRYIDWARGLAVLVMLEAHTFDAWTRLADRSSHAYRNFIIVGGFAAPLFLWLAGLGAVLSAESALRRTGNRRSAAAVVCKRGLEIFILAFLFRVQSFIVSPGNSLLSLFRVDILNVMGPSIVVVGLVWLACRGRTAMVVVAFSSLAIVVSMFTPLIRVAAWVSTVPVGLQWYLRPMGEHTVFTLFPWAGFVAGGAAVGTLLSGTVREREPRLHLMLAVVGATLVVLGFYTASLPIYPESSFWTTSPTYFVIRLGVMTLALSLIYGLESLCSRWSIALEPLARLGQASLFVYWIHVELVYGYASWPLRRRLPVPYAVMAYVAFCLLMYGAVVLRDRFAAREARAKLGSRPETVQA